MNANIWLSIFNEAEVYKGVFVGLLQAIQSQGHAPEISFFKFLQSITTHTINRL